MSTRRSKTARPPRRARRPRRGGWMLLEACISVLLLGVLVATLLSIEAAAGRANHFHLTKQRCIAAAQATLDGIAATGEALPDADVRRLWPGLRVTVRRAPGEGDWSGLVLVTAVARGPSGGREVTVELRRYVAPPAGKGARL